MDEIVEVTFVGSAKTRLTPAEQTDLESHIDAITGIMVHLGIQSLEFTAPKKGGRVVLTKL